MGKKKKIDYKKYIGQYVKRFYTPFEEKNIYKIKDFRIHTFKDPLDEKNVSIPEFLYDDDSWRDIEDSVIITNELPIVEDERIANVNHPDYKGYNPFAIIV